MITILLSFDLSIVILSLFTLFIAVPLCLLLSSHTPVIFLAFAGLPTSSSRVADGEQ
jgi:hypothetical protein